MQRPLELEFKDMPPSAAVEKLIRNRMAKLEQFYDRITGCRVIVLDPHQHHHQGKKFQVHIRLTVPGAVLVSSHDSDERGHEDAHVAVRDSFDAVQRQLEDYVRKQRGEVKAHAPRAN
jgi:ribosome-associated translation inhibitor RaiA